VNSFEKEILVKRFKENPLLIPEDVDWVMRQYPENERGVFNCGVIYDEKEKIFRMLFRGGSGPFSDIGYAESKDGKNWRKGLKREAPVLRHSDNNYWNGYCSKGVEDPRIIKPEWTEGWFYLCYRSL